VDRLENIVEGNSLDIEQKEIAEKNKERKRSRQSISKH